MTQTMGGFDRTLQVLADNVIEEGGATAILGGTTALILGPVSVAVPQTNTVGAGLLYIPIDRSTRRK